jgi:hypothetical protein
MARVCRRVSTVSRIHARFVRRLSGLQALGQESCCRRRPAQRQHRSRAPPWDPLHRSHTRPSVSGSNLWRVSRSHPAASVCTCPMMPRRGGVQILPENGPHVRHETRCRHAVAYKPHLLNDALASNRKPTCNICPASARPQRVSGNDSQSRARLRLVRRIRCDNDCSSARLFFHGGVQSPCHDAGLLSKAHSTAWCKPDLSLSRTAELHGL